MPRKSNLERLAHMRDAANEAVSFIANLSYEEFVSDRIRQYAVIRAIEIIGEAGANVTQDYRAAHPDIPWQAIIGMRNHLIHAYFDINISLTWQTVMEDLPPFIVKLDDLLKEEGSYQFRLPET